MPTLSAYGAAKAALRAMTRSIAAELLPRGIRVNAVTPGPIGIDGHSLQKVGMPKEAKDQVYLQMAESVPMKRLGRPEEIAKAVASGDRCNLHDGSRASSRWRMVSTLRLGPSGEDKLRGANLLA